MPGKSLTHRSNADQPIEMVNVHVHEHAKQARQNLATESDEGARKRRIRRHREHRFVVDLRLCPVHQQLNVPGCGQRRWLLVLVVVRPQVLVSRSPRHRRAGSLVAVLGDGAVDQIDAIEEVHHCVCVCVCLFVRYKVSGFVSNSMPANTHTMYGDPVVEILAVRQFHHLSQIDARM